VKGSRQRGWKCRSGLGFWSSCSSCSPSAGSAIRAD